MKKTFIIFSVFAAAAVFFGCSSASAKTDNEAVKAVVEFEIKYQHKGTRSEGRSGYLKINGEILPDCFTMVAVNGKVYAFITKNTTWGDDGYFPDIGESAESVIPLLNEKISDTDLARGWSEASGRYINIPDSWIFVKWENGSAVISPDKIIVFVKIKVLKQIPRHSGFIKLHDNLLK